MSLQACKSQFGHSEAAAGAAGLLFSCVSAGLVQTFDLMHLRSMNAHVAAALNASPAGLIRAPRQQSPANSAHSRVGLSSFAYQVRFR